jgi:hypothetical protein
VVDDAQVAKFPAAVRKYSYSPRIDACTYQRRGPELAVTPRDR